jgi:hypothetical protein
MVESDLSDFTLRFVDSDVGLGINIMFRVWARGLGTKNARVPVRVIVYIYILKFSLLEKISGWATTVTMIM